MIRTLLAALAIGLAAPLAQAADTTLTLRLPGGGTALTIRAASQGGAWTIRSFAGGAERQRFRVETEVPEGLPWLGDANADGTADLWVPVAQGNVNTVYRIFLANPQTGRLTAAGEVGGLAFAQEGAGLVALGRSSCCAFGYTVFSFPPGGEATELGAIEVEINEAGRPIRCDLAAAASLPRALTQRYCRLANGELPGSFGPPRN